MVRQMREETEMSIRRVSRAVSEASSTVGAWCRTEPSGGVLDSRRRPVRDDGELRSMVREVCHGEYYQSYGYRRVCAVLRRRYGRHHNRKTIYRIMKDEGLLQPKKRWKPKRPWRLEKMRPLGPHQAWQMDMTSFQLSDLTPMYLMVVIDCWSRRIVGWTLDRRCRAHEWIATLRQALEDQGLTDKAACAALKVRTDNGAQPCSKKFVEFLGSRGVRGQYTGYNAPDDNAFVERVIRSIKEEEIWTNHYDTWAEAHESVQRYVEFYNNERLHSELGDRSPAEYEAEMGALKAA